MEESKNHTQRPLKDFLREIAIQLGEINAGVPDTVFLYGAEGDDKRDFRVAFHSGLVEEVIGRNFSVLIKHGNPDRGYSVNMDYYFPRVNLASYLDSNLPKVP